METHIKQGYLLIDQDQRTKVRTQAKGSVTERTQETGEPDHEEVGVGRWLEYGQMETLRGHGIQNHMARAQICCRVSS